MIENDVVFSVFFPRRRDRYDVSNQCEVFLAVLPI